MRETGLSHAVVVAQRHIVRELGHTSKHGFYLKVWETIGGIFEENPRDTMGVNERCNQRSPFCELNFGTCNKKRRSCKTRRTKGRMGLMTNCLFARSQSSLLSHFPKVCFGTDTSRTLRLCSNKGGFKVLELRPDLVGFGVDTTATEKI
jgi:hypothetical protein